MNERIEQLKNFIKNNPLALAAIAIILFLAAIFWKSLLLIFQGVFYAAISLVIFIGVILLWTNLHYINLSLIKIFLENK